jgi:hypothetical protein
MQIQSVNRTDVERAYVNITNSDGQTLTSHYPVFKFGMSANTASVATNEGGRANNTGGEHADQLGAFIGLADGDIADGAVGRVAVYGYHESALVMRAPTSVTTRPGVGMGPGSAAAANSVGVASTGALQGLLGPVVALDTVTATLHSLGTVGQNYTDHVMLRCL